MASGKSVRAGRAFVELTLRDFVSAGLKAVQAKLKAFAASVRAAGLAMAKLGAMIASPLALAGLSFAKMGDTLQKMSMRTGTTVEFLSRLSHAAQIAGTSVQDLEKGFKTSAKFLLGAGQGLATSAKALNALGLSFADLKDLSPEEQFLKMTEALANVDDHTLKAGLAMTIFGKAGTAMLPMLDKGADGLKAMMEESDRLGLTMSTEDANAAALLTDKMTQLWSSVKMAVFHIGAGLAPMLTKAASKMRDMATVAVAWVKENRELVVLVAKLSLGLIAAGAALMLISPAITLASAAIGALVTVVGVLQGVLAVIVSPLGFVVGALVYLAHATGNLGAITQEAAGVIKDSWGGIKDAALTAFGGVTDALMSGEWKLAAEIAWLGIKAAWASGLRPLREAWIGFKAWFQKSVLAVGTWLKKAWKKDMSSLEVGWEVTKGLIKGEGWEAQKVKARKMLQETNAELGQLDAQKQAGMDAINAEVSRKMAALATDEKSKRDALQAARDEAAKRRAEHKSKLEEESKDLEVPDLPPLPDLDQVPGWDGMATAAKKIAASGQFSSAAVARMGGVGKDPAEETAKNTEKTVEVLEKVETTLHKMNVSGAYSFQ